MTNGSNGGNWIAILRLEDDGAKRWTRQYEAKIKDYLGFEEEGEN